MDTDRQFAGVICLPESKRCRQLIHETLALIGNKWTVPIVLMLQAKSPLRNSELKRGITGITAKELAKQLRLLEESGLIGRKVYPSVPPRVEYWLTDVGRSLHPVLERLAEWAVLNGDRVESNKKLFASASKQESQKGITVHRMR